MINLGNKSLTLLILETLFLSARKISIMDGGVSLNYITVEVVVLVEEEVEDLDSVLYALSRIFFHCRYVAQIDYPSFKEGICNNQAKSS